MIKTLICITCPMGCALEAEVSDGGEITVFGNGCPRGENFAQGEITCPMRSLSTTVRTVFPQMPLLPVRTRGEIPKDFVMPAMNILKGMNLREKVQCGDVILSNILETGCDIIATLDI